MCQSTYLPVRDCKAKPALSPFQSSLPTLPSPSDLPFLTCWTANVPASAFWELVGQACNPRPCFTWLPLTSGTDQIKPKTQTYLYFWNLTSKTLSDKMCSHSYLHVDNSHCLASDSPCSPAVDPSTGCWHSGPLAKGRLPGEQNV